MKTVQGNMLQALRNTDGFLDQYAELLPVVVVTGARQKLRELMLELAGHSTAQEAATLMSKGASKRQQHLRGALLRGFMAPIAKVARLELPNTAEMAPLKMPRGKPSVERLAAAAYGMAKAAGKFAPTFIQAGLANDFVEKMNEATSAMLESVGTRSSCRNQRSYATTGLQDALSRGRKTVHVLDAFIKSDRNIDTALLASWNRVKRVHRGAVHEPVPSPSVHALVMPLRLEGREAA